MNPWQLPWTLKSPARWTVALGCRWTCAAGGETCLHAGAVSAAWEGEDFRLLHGAITAPSKVMVYAWCLSLGGELLIYLFDNVFSTRGHINSSYRYERASAPQHPRPGQSSPPAPRVTSQLSDLLSWTPEIRYL